MYDIERPSKNLSMVEIWYLLGISSLRPEITFHMCFNEFKTHNRNITIKTLFKINTVIKP